MPLYELDGASFQSKDAYGHLCTVTGALWRSYGRYFDGVDDKISLGSPSALDLTGSYTVCSWVNSDVDRAVDGVVLGRFDSGAHRGFMLNWHQDEQLRYVHATQGATEGGYLKNDITTASTYNDGNWHFVSLIHIVGIGSEMRIDEGSVGADTTRTEGISAFTQDFIIGCQDYATPRYCPVNVGEVFVYNRVLNPLEI